jgi:predicted nucleotidyltransferase
MFLATFPTPLLDALHAQRRAQAELARQQVLQSALKWLTEQGHRFGITQGYLFGSVTQPGKFSPHSDVDLAVESFEQGDPFGLSSYLSLHLNRDVDIVPLDQCHFAPKIRATGQVWNGAKSLDSPLNSEPNSDC